MDVKVKICELCGKIEYKPKDKYTITLEFNGKKQSKIDVCGECFDKVYNEFERSVEEADKKFEALLKEFGINEED